MRVFETREVLDLVFAWWGIDGREPQWDLPAESPDQASWSGLEIRSLRFAGHPQETTENSVDLTNAFEDEGRRPRSAAGPIQASYELYLLDWTHDSGEPGDKYDPELAALLTKASTGLQIDPVQMQDLLNKLETIEPGMAHILANDPEGIDAMLLQFPSFSNDHAQTSRLRKSSS